MSNGNSAELRFSPGVCKALAYYVYRLLDPRNGQTFYVGKGKNNRVFDHVRADTHAEDLKKDIKEDTDGILEQNEDGTIYDEESYKIQTIRAIHHAGLEVLFLIHRYGMDEETAFQVESALIDAYDPYGNIQNGHDSSFGCCTVQQLEEKYNAASADLKDDKVLFINVRGTYNDSGKNSLYEAVRASWRLSQQHAEQADYILPYTDGIIKGIFKAEKWYESPDNPGRIEFVGKAVTDSSVCDRYIGHALPIKFAPKKGSRAPCRYSFK